MHFGNFDSFVDFNGLCLTTFGLNFRHLASSYYFQPVRVTMHFFASTGFAYLYLQVIDASSGVPS